MLMKKPSFTKSIVALLLFLFPCYLFSQTYFNTSTGVPVDGTGHAGPTATIAPPASMLANDLAIVYVEYRGAGATITMSVSGGQTWNNPVANYSPGAFNQTVSIFWCTYNGNNWPANPVVSVGGGNTNGLTAVMYVFRPSNSNNVWGVNVNPVNTSSAAATNSIAGITPTASNTLTMAFWAVGATNTWTSLSPGAT